MEIKFYLKRAEAENATSIFARISYYGARLKYYLPEKINPKFWNPKTQQAKETAKFREYPEFNARLKNMATQIYNVFRKFQNDNDNMVPAGDVFKAMLDVELKRKLILKEGKCFISFFKTIIENAKNGVRTNPKTGKSLSRNTYKTYTTTLNHVLQYQVLKKLTVDFDIIDLNFYTDFTEFLIKTLKLRTNSVGKDIKILKLILNEATERGINTNLAFRGKRFKALKVDTDSIYLDKDELQEVESFDLSSNERLDRVRDLFLIACHTGLRYSDFTHINTDNISNRILTVKQKKTEGVINIPLNDTSLRIIKKYEGKLPRGLSNQKTNQYLKDLTKQIPCLKKKVSLNFTKAGVNTTSLHEKWELVTTHTGRRSFATNLYLAGVPSQTLRQITGHKDDKSFFRYIKLSTTEHAEIILKHYDAKNTIKAV